MTLSMPVWNEPDYGKADGVNAKPVLFVISATVSGLTIGNTYRVYRFDNPKTLPTSNFAKGPFTKSFSFTATDTSMTLDHFDSFMSDSTIFYRAVQE